LIEKKNYKGLFENFFPENWIFRKISQIYFFSLPGFEMRSAVIQRENPDPLYQKILLKIYILQETP